MNKPEKDVEAPSQPADNVKPLNYREQFSASWHSCTIEVYTVHAHCRADMLAPNSSSNWSLMNLYQMAADASSSPCAAASQASMDCLNRNDYDRDACIEYFQAYRDCKNTWVSFYIFTSK